MVSDIQAIEKTFRSFVEGSLVEQNVDAVMELFTDDLMGIGMGAQGIVRCKEDVRPILSSNKSEGNASSTTVSYSNMQIRCYEQKYASICAAVEVAVVIKGERSISRVGQCASLRKVDGDWKIYMLQATPLSVSASEMEAYPLTFAEDELELYHMQEQMSELARQNTIAIYKINFTADRFDYYINKDERSVKVEKGEKYEKVLFQSANSMLKEQDKLRFIETFSIGNITSSFQSGKHEISLDYESLLPEGAVLWLRSILRLYTGKEGDLKGNLYLIDIDEQKKNELEMLRRAQTDSMTGLYNKQTMREKINRLLSQAEPSLGGAFLMIDLDYFKQINDTYGHGEGDRVIQETAAILKGNSRKTDVAGRLGGDEFGLYYRPPVSKDFLCRRAEKICKMVREIRCRGEGDVSPTCSIGITIYANEKCFQDLYEKADKALYIRKKEQGRNGYTFYED